MQKKSIEYARPKGAPSEAFLSLPVYEQSVSRMVYASVSASVPTNHYLNDEAGLVKVSAKTNGVFVAFSLNADKAPAKAVQTLTASDNAADNETITIGTRVYRFKNTLAQAYDIKIGSSAAITLDNVKAAVNASGTPGTEYFVGTEEHPDVIATTNGDTTQVFEAKVSGAAGNAIASTSTAADLAFGAAVFASGADGNFEDYIPAGGELSIAIAEDVEHLSFIGDAGAATVTVVEI